METYLPLLLISSGFNFIATEPTLDVAYQWTALDFVWNSPQSRDEAIKSQAFIPANCLPIDVDAWQDNKDNTATRIFVSIPRISKGIPATITTVSNKTTEQTTLLAPFPSWKDQKQDNCDTGTTNVFRMKIDKCGKLWVLDCGKVSETGFPLRTTICPPKVKLFDLKNNDKHIDTFVIPPEVLDSTSLLVTIAVDVRDDTCSDPYLYIADITAFKLIVYHIKERKSWAVLSNYFFPSPSNGLYDIAGAKFNLMDGLIAIALGPIENNDRILYFHSLASVQEGWVAASVIRDQTLVQNFTISSAWEKFTLSEFARISQSPPEDMTDKGILIFSLVSQMAIACWDSHTKEFTRDKIHTIYKNKETLQFASGLKVQGDTLWVITNELQDVMVGKVVDPKDVRFRILRGAISGLVAGTPCDLK